MADSFPVQKAISDGCNEIIGIYNYPENFEYSKKEVTFSKLISVGLPKNIARLLRKREIRKIGMDKLLSGFSSSNGVKIIRPSKNLPLTSSFDTDKERLNACIDLGIQDARRFVSQLNQ